MAIFGGILLVIGIILFFVQKNYSTKLRSIQTATASTIADLQNIANAIAGEIGGGNLREYVKVSGVIRTDNPLYSELKQEPCVHYTMRVVREYEEQQTVTDSDGKRRTETRRSSETISSNSQSIPFMLQDNSGELLVNLDGGDIDMVQILNEFPQDQSGSVLSFGGFSLPINFSRDGRRTLGYRYTESILPCDRQVLVIGTAADEGGRLTLRKPTQSDKKFIISLKSEEELAKATESAAIWFYRGMIACGAIGLVLLIVGLILKK